MCVSSIVNHGDIQGCLKDLYNKLYVKQTKIYRRKNCVLLYIWHAEVQFNTSLCEVDPFLSLEKLCHYA